MSQLAYPLLALYLTHSPAMAGLIATVFGLPYLIFSLPAGVYVDRWDRRAVMICCDAIRAVNAASIPVAAMLGQLHIAQLFLTAAVEGTCFVFFNVAETAALPRVVAKSQIPAASSQNQASQAAGSLIAPPLAGLIYQAVGRAAPFLFDSVSYVVSVVSLLFIRVPFQLERVRPKKNMRAEIGEGLRWLADEPLVRYMVGLTGSLNFVGSGTLLILIILAKHHGASPSVIGVMLAISAVGGLVGAMIAPRIQKRFSFSQVILACVWISACMVPLFAVAPNAFVLGAIGGVLYFVGPIYNAVQFSYRMAIIPDELQGRVNSAARMVIFGTMPLGSALSGILLQAIGANPSVLLFAGVSVCVAVLTSLNTHVRNAPAYADVSAA